MTWSLILPIRDSGKSTARPELDNYLKALRAGDTFVVWRLDRLGRNLADLVQIVTGLEARGVGFESLSEAINTTSTTGKLVFHIFASLAEFERNLIRERTVAGLKAARARGKNGGRPKKLTEKKSPWCEHSWRTGKTSWEILRSSLV